MFEENSSSQIGSSKGLVRLAITQEDQDEGEKKTLFEQMSEEDQQVIKDAVLDKFCGLTTHQVYMKPYEEIRLAIKLMIHSFKNEREKAF